MEIQISKMKKKKGKKKSMSEGKEEIQTNPKNKTRIKEDKEEEIGIIEEEGGQEVTIREVEGLLKVTQVILLVILIVMMILVLQAEKIVEKQVTIVKESKLVGQDLVLKGEDVEMTLKNHKNSQSNKVLLFLWDKKAKIMIKIGTKEKQLSYKIKPMLV